MNLVRTLKSKKIKKAIVMGVDASSTAIAFAIFDQQDDKTILIETSKIKLDKMPMDMKLSIISSYIPTLFNKWDIDYVFVEQPIYIQNPATSRVLGQISGHLMGKCLERCKNVSEVTIASWKSYIGYKNVSKAEKEAWNVKLGEKESKKMAASERKQRTIRIVHEKVSGIDHIVDNDICDAIGIAMWGIDHINEEHNNGS
jgi:Holliday junction resolvasome RuvABC endonuclease subunit